MMPTGAVWLRSDLRLADHTALHQATREHARVLLFFVLDPRVLADFAPGKKPAGFFLGSLLKLRDRLHRKGKELVLLEGDPSEVIPAFLAKQGIRDLYFNKDYEPAGIGRDRRVAAGCAKLKIRAHAFKDRVLFEESEILSKSKKPFKGFTAYRKAYFRKARLDPPKPAAEPEWDRIGVAWQNPHSQVAWTRAEKLVAQGRADAAAGLPEPGEVAARSRLENFVRGALTDYSRNRDLPAEPGTAAISFDLRAGTLSPRQIWAAVRGSRSRKLEQDKFLSELAWRDFFIMIGFHFPQVFERNFRGRFKVRWRNRSKEFQAWCEGRTGYPIVDAGMRQLHETGWMHNRVRMITAMFLVKDLLIDWKWGERYFLSQLIDADRAVNNGNWQWCASTGCDAHPYFRVLNPDTLAKKFDPKGAYVRRWVPEAQGQNYPSPIVDHSTARTRCLLAYRQAHKRHRPNR